jgi:hypothetical protein
MPKPLPGGPSRRGVLGLVLGGGLLVAGSRWGRAATPVTGDPDPSTLAPGEFCWHPDRAGQGPIVIMVSIPKQLAHVYRGGVLIGMSTCSTGKPGHSTPAGLFTVINKFKVHRSAKYGDDMPNTLRLTRKGVALHGGDVPGYPMSHGCVHLPLAFADALFELTDLGTLVIIGGHADHLLVGAPGIVPAGGAGRILAAREAARSIAPSGRDADTSILVSAAERRIYLLQDGTIVAQGPATIKDPQQPLGTNVFLWRGGDVAGSGSIWQGDGFQPVPGGAVAGGTASLARLEGSAKVMGTIVKVMHPGTVVLTTDEPLNPSRQAPRVRHRAARPKRTKHTGAHHRRRRSS